MPPFWKAGWTKAALILFATLPLVAAITDPRVSAFDPPNAENSHRFWASRPAPENAPSPRMSARFALLDNYTTAFVGGGLDDDKYAEHWELHYYNIITGDWKRMGVSPNGEMILPRDSFKMATINTETIKDLVIIMGGFWLYKENHMEIRDMSQFRSPDFNSEESWLYPDITGDEPPPLYHGGCTTWKDLFIVYGGLKDVGSNDIYVLNVTSWTWSHPTVTGNPLPFAEDASMVVVPNWKGRDTIFIYSNSFTLLNDNIPGQTPCPGGRNKQYRCVFTVDIETWKATMHVTPTPGPKGQFGSSTNLVSIDPNGNRYFYHYGGGYIDFTTGERIFSSDLNVLRVEPVIDWVRVPVRNNNKIQGSWQGLLIGGLPQNMPAWIGEEPLVHIQGAQVGPPYVTTETHLTLGGISPIDSILNPPTVNGSPVPDVFEVQAGDYIQFKVDPRNAFGAPLPYGGDDVFVFLRRLDGVEKSCATEEKANADTVQYIINCQVTLHGNYTFKLQIRDFPPTVPKYRLFVQPSSVSIANSIAEGYGMQQANAGEVAIYKTKLYDVYGNRASVVKEEVHVTAVVGCNGNVSLAEAELLDANSFEKVDAVVTLDDPVSSLYTIQYIPTAAGVCKVQNMVNNNLLGNVTYVAIGDPIPPPGFIALGSGAGATFMVLNIASCVAACAASYHFGFKANGSYREGLIFSSGALALIGSLLYIGEPLDASCKARSAIGMMAFGMLVGVMFSQTGWYLGYYRTPMLMKQLPISPKRALKYASAAVCFEGLLIIIVQTTAPIRRSIFTVNEKAYIGCNDASGNNVLYAHLALLCFLSLISVLTSAHKAPDVATSVNSVIGYNLTVLGLFLVGLIGILRNEDLQIFFVLQSLDIWIACMMTFGLVIYSKVRLEGKSTKGMANIMGGSGQMKTLAVGSTSELGHSKSEGNQSMALARPHLRQDDLTRTTWKKCVYFHPNELPYGVIYYEYNKPGICLENMGEITSFNTEQSGLRYGLRLQIRGEDKVLAFEKETDRAEYLEALKRIRATKGSTKGSTKQATKQSTKG